MNSIARPFARRAALAVATVLLATCAMTLAPTGAEASPETLQRSVSNILQAPLDIVLAPVVAFRTLITNLRDVEDTPAVQVAYALPGYVWLTGLQAGAGVLRGVAGLLELVPGIVLLPFKADLDALYDPADRGGALVEVENPLGEVSWLEYAPMLTFDLRFGITYTSAEN